MTIIELKQEQNKNERQREVVASEIKGLEDKAAEYATSAQTAAESGDADRYLEYKQKADRARAEAYVKGVMLDKQTRNYTRGEVVEAWNNYIKQYSKEYSKSLDRYNKAMKELQDVFESMMTAQREALVWRDYACNMIGYTRQSIIEDNDVSAIFSMPFIPFTFTRVNEAALAAALYGDNLTARNNANALLRYHLLKPIG